uniref:C2H2-type domain-containing protein n=1 Tax=Schistosoma mansoni TaxID=6183 RepID=A0A5K4EQX5_SCHMA
MATSVSYRRCVNCKENIIESNFDIHEAFCCRNVTTCPDCGVSLLRTQLLEHHLDKHSQIKCTYCESLFKESSVLEHELICPRRLVECVFCNLEVTIDLLDDHESTCGARTERCSDCGNFVMLKDLETHRCKKPIECLTNLQNDLEKDFRVALNLQYEDCIQNVHSATFQKHVESRNDSSRHKTTVGRDEWESNSMIPCEFCYSCYSIDMIDEHQVLCLIENGPLMSSTEEQTNESKDPCNELTTNSKITPSPCSISQASGSSTVSSMINPIKVQSNKFPSSLQQLKSTNGKSPQSSSSSSSSSLTVPQNNTVNIKTSNHRLCPSRSNNNKSTSVTNKNQHPSKSVHDPSMNKSLHSNSLLNLQKKKNCNSLKKQKKSFT